MHAVIEHLQSKKQIIWAMTGNSVGDCLALKKADIGVADLNACDAARETCDILLTEAGPGVLLRCLLTSRKIPYVIKVYCIHAVAFTVYSVLAFMLLALIWKFNIPPLVLLLAVNINDRFLVLVVEWQKMENHDLRMTMGMKSDQKGVHVRPVDPTVQESRDVRPSHVILTFDWLGLILQTIKYEKQKCWGLRASLIKRLDIL